MNQKILKARLSVKWLNKKIEEDIGFFGSVSAWGYDQVMKRNEVLSFLNREDKEWLRTKYNDDDYRKIQIF